MYKDYILICKTHNIKLEMNKYRADMRKFEVEIWRIIHGNCECEFMDNTPKVSERINGQG